MTVMDNEDPATPEALSLDDLTHYTVTEARVLWRRVTGAECEIEAALGLTQCLNHAMRHALELAAVTADEMDAAHVGGAILAAHRRIGPNAQVQTDRTPVRVGPGTQG